MSEDYADHVYFPDGTGAQCPECNCVFKTAHQYPNVDVEEVCPECNKESMFKGYSEY